MADVFLEQIVKKKSTPASIVIKVLIFMAGILVFLVSIAFMGYPLFGSVALLVGVGGLYLAWMFAANQDLEFEYIYTNGEIDFDKIIAKRRRKRVITVRISSFDEFDKYDAVKNPLSKYEVKYDLCVSPVDEGTHFATFHNKDGKNCILLFSPSERLLEAIHAQHRRRSFSK